MASSDDDSIPEQRGRVAVVTGANSGLGLETTRALAKHGARVILASRSVDKANAAVATIQGEVPDAELEVIVLDLADLASVERFATELAARHPSLDLLINNAGVMALPRRETADGFEMQIGTNHLGHFALTARLWPLLREAPAARVVTVSSLMHYPGRIDFEDLQGARRYEKWSAYCQSKLANLLFAFELSRRLLRVEARAISVAAHPGYSATELQVGGATMTGRRWAVPLWHGVNRAFAQSAASGALPQLHAATAADVRPGDFFGPGALQIWGKPKRVEASQAARDEATARRLWEISESLTGVAFDGL
ncbi:MAG: SDR family NAD(P)-dependent oxidoreductase [Myxococcales bacterium]|nr:SDR family NAD(P)-dependent oxidoreductase [Myxococcales bacterium]